MVCYRNHILVADGDSRRCVKIKKNRKNNDDESSNLEVGRSIATLKQKKASTKSSFTRTRHKFEELLNEDLPSRREVKEYQKKIYEQLQQVMILLTKLSVLYEQSKNQSRGR